MRKCVSDWFYNLSNLTDCPKTFLDNGANLKNGHVYSVLQMLGLQLADGVPKNDEGVKVNESVVRYTSAYNPQANTQLTDLIIGSAVSGAPRTFAFN